MNKQRLLELERNADLSITELRKEPRWVHVPPTISADRPRLTWAFAQLHSARDLHPLRLTLLLAISVGLMGCYESFSRLDVRDPPPDAGCGWVFAVGRGPPHECGESVVGTGCRPCSEAANRARLPDLATIDTALEECPDRDWSCLAALAVDDADMEACSVCNAINTVACINRRTDCDDVWADFACCMEASCAGAHIYEAPTTLDLRCFEVECASQIAAWSECFDGELREACVEVAAAQCTGS
jgi:hypothetical protein